MSIKIALDAGHGLYTAGKQTPDGIKEWTLNDKVRDYTVEYLEPYDCEFIFPDNNEGKVDESLASRVKAYIGKADVMVSIHHNAYTGKWGNATGVGVFTDKNPTSADTKLAKAIYTRLVENTGLRGRGIKKQPFWVINQNKVPAALVEGGFMDNRSDYAVITSETGQRAYAKAVADGLVEFLGLEKKDDVIPVEPKVDVLYQVWDDTLNKWLPNVKNLNDYAGIYGHNICCVLAHLSEGNIIYKVHYKGGKWLPAVANRTDYAGLYNKAIDGLMMKTDTGKTIHYAVHLRKKNKWLPFVTGYNEKDDNNGYAGIIGQEIDGIKIYID